MTLDTMAGPAFEEAKRKAGVKGETLDDLTKIAAQVEYLPKPAEKVEATLDVLALYHTMPAIQASYDSLVDKLDMTKVQDVLRGLKKDAAGKATGLDYIASNEGLKKIGHLLMAAWNKGLPDENAIEDNFKNLQNYLNSFDSELKGQNPGTTLEQIRRLIAKGRTWKAFTTLVEAISELDMHRDEESLIKYATKDDHEIKGALGEGLASVYNVRDEKLKVAPEGELRRLGRERAQAHEAYGKAPEPSK